MKITINTKDKVLVIEDKISVKELFDFIVKFNLMEYNIESKYVNNSIIIDNGKNIETKPYKIGDIMFNNCSSERTMLNLLMDL